MSVCGWLAIGLGVWVCLMVLLMALFRGGEER